MDIIKEYVRDEYGRKIGVVVATQDGVGWSVIRRQKDGHQYLMNQYAQGKLQLNGNLLKNGTFEYDFYDDDVAMKIALGRTMARKKKPQPPKAVKRVLEKVAIRAMRHFMYQLEEGEW